MMESSGYEYRCSALESFDSIALAVYGDEKYAAELMCANPGYAGQLEFTGGERLALPVIVTPEDTGDEEEAKLANAQAPWKA